MVHADVHRHDGEDTIFHASAMLFGHGVKNATPLYGRMNKSDY
jgi:hypothetical protein